MLAGEAGLGFGRAPQATDNKAPAQALTAAPTRGCGTGSQWLPEDLGQSMIRKSGNRFSEKIMLQREILR